MEDFQGFGRFGAICTRGKVDLSLEIEMSVTMKITIFTIYRWLLFSCLTTEQLYASEAIVLNRLLPARC